MFKETVVLVMGALLLLQGCYGRPQSATDPKASESAEGDQEVNLKTAFLAVTVFEEFSTFTEEILNAGEKLTKAVLADVTATGDKSNEEINRKTEILSSIVDKIDNLKKLTRDEFEEQKWDVGIQLLNVLEDFDIENKKESTATEDQVFHDYFKNNGVDDFRKVHETKLKEFFNNINKHFEIFWKGLSAEEQTKYKEFNDWQEKVKKESDLKKKVEIIGEIFSLSKLIK